MEKVTGDVFFVDMCEHSDHKRVHRSAESLKQEIRTLLAGAAVQGQVILRDLPFDDNNKETASDFWFFVVNRPADAVGSAEPATEPGPV